MKVIILFIIFVAVRVACGTDPAKCQRFIKYMLINSCGATKRHSNSLSSYLILDKEEIEQRYQEMVETGIIKVTIALAESGYPNSNSRLLEDSYIPGDRYNINDQLKFKRWKRGLFPRDRKRDTELTTNDKREKFTVIGPPLPGALKAKCCGEYLCTTDDFKGFCG